jgi:uncharacterized protein (TIGR03083 family)
MPGAAGDGQGEQTAGVDIPLRSPLPIATYAAAIRTDAARLASAARAAGPDAAVPTCPNWQVRDLVQHTSGVHRWATSIVATPRTEAWNVDLPEVVGSWPPDDELVPWFLDGADRLATALQTADPALQCWTFLKATSPLAMWARRQAHETAIHRVDGESAAGASGTPFEPAFAADGVDELLTCFITRRSSKLRADPPRTLRVTVTDSDGDWDVIAGPDRVVTLPGGTGPADATVRGEASDVYQALWNRPLTAPLDVAGDPALLGLFQDKVQVRWS